MANEKTPTCYFCHEPIEKDAEDFHCSGCKAYICDGEEHGCGSRIGPFMQPNHKPEDHVMPCGVCGEARCDDECGVCGEQGCDDDAHRVQNMGYEELPPRPARDGGA